MRLRGKDLLGIKDLTIDEIEMILSSAVSFRKISGRYIKKVPTLRGKTAINLFYEPSTRTRTSFEIAAKRMSADLINISVSTSSVAKGETLKDTAKNLEAMQPDCIVVRHSSSGVPHLLANYLDCSVINAGDGKHEHPSQALLDLLTVRDAKGSIRGLKVVIAGDISHSRVARSNIYAFNKMGADVMAVAPRTMMPPDIEMMGCRTSYNMDKAIDGADVIIMLRVQLERHSAVCYPSLREYSDLFGLNMRRLANASKDVAVLHPGPVNRGVEITPEVIDSASSLILDQVKNGVAIRMAIFYLLMGADN